MTATRKIRETYNDTQDRIIQYLKTGLGKGKHYCKSKYIAKELGLRLGQGSEFSLLVAYGAFAAGKIAATTSFLIQLTTIVTFIVSTYIVVFKYPTPIALSDKMRQD